MQSQDRKWKAELATCNQFGQRLTDDGIRRGNVGGGALVYRKKVDENSGYPHPLKHSCPGQTLSENPG